MMHQESWQRRSTLWPARSMPPGSWLAGLQRNPREGPQRQCTTQKRHLWLRPPRQLVRTPWRVRSERLRAHVISCRGSRQKTRLCVICSKSSRQTRPPPNLVSTWLRAQQPWLPHGQILLLPWLVLKLRCPHPRTVTHGQPHALSSPRLHSSRPQSERGRRPLQRQPPLQPLWSRSVCVRSPPPLSFPQQSWPLRLPPLFRRWRWRC
mmetsp:Transcript_7341/g.12666  ORF Transcript_7341/g.12666 Transcript_7341/m.12666 type:complete len:207 (+) Transcript_7341:395-1015(+)